MLNAFSLEPSALSVSRFALCIKRLAFSVLLSLRSAIQAFIQFIHHAAAADE